MTLYNNFLLKRGVGLFSRVGLISGDYGICLINKHMSQSIIIFMLLHLQISSIKTVDNL